MNILKLIVSALLVIGFSAHAAELENVKIADAVDIAGEKLILNGYGLRKVTKFGLPIKVYVGALYLKEKNQDSSAIVASEATKQLVMTFVRSVDRQALADGFRATYNDACLAACEEKGKQFTKFQEYVRNAGPYEEVRLTFFKDRVKVEWGKHPAAEIADPALSKNLLNLFINKDKPPTQDLRKGLLGLQ